jgi:hypothetical protein
MGMTVWLNIRSGKKYESIDDDLSALFAQQEALDVLAAKLGVTPLTTFFDDTDVRYNMDEDGEFEESDDGWPANAATWHEAASALHTAETLRAHLAANPNTLADCEGWSQQHVIDDLETMVPGLKKAAAENRSVHLLVVM